MMLRTVPGKDACCFQLVRRHQEPARGKAHLHLNPCCFGGSKPLCTVPKCPNPKAAVQPEVARFRQDLKLIISSAGVKETGWCVLHSTECLTFPTGNQQRVGICSNYVFNICQMPFSTPSVSLWAAHTVGQLGRFAGNMRFLWKSKVSLGPQRSSRVAGQKKVVQRRKGPFGGTFPATQWICPLSLR